MTKMPLRCTLLLLIAAALLVHPVVGAPFYMLSNNRQKCVSVVSPPGGITFIVDYYCPDVMLDTNLTANDARLKDLEQQMESLKVGSGLDQIKSEYENQLKALQKAAFRGQPNDMKIIMMERPNRNGAAATNWKERRARQATAEGDQPARPKPSGRISEPVKNTTGRMTYVTTDYGGQVDICVQSMAANSARPSRYALTVQSEEDVLSRTRMLEEMKGAMEEEKNQQNAEQQKKAQRHLTRFQADLLGMDRKLGMILQNADQSKTQETEFQNQSIQMNRATTYWPAIHIVVLVIAGFTQVNHMVHYLKSRHIY